MRTCVRCGAGFGVGMGRPASRCAPCRADHRKDYDLARGALRGGESASDLSSRLRAYRLKSEYGITIADYEAMYVAQRGCCSICAGYQPVLCVDHDHGTGAIRSLLCRPCNAALGLLRDDPARVRAAADYLEAHVVR